MAVTIDLGDPYSPYGDLNPRYKHECWKTISLALAVAHVNASINHTGPVVTKSYLYHYSGYNLVFIYYKSIDKRLEIRSPFGFELGCISSHVPDTPSLHSPGTATTPSGDTIIVYFPLCTGAYPIPKYIRYLWRDNQGLFCV